MMINHILPPLRTPVDEHNLENLIDVNGCFDGQTERALNAIISGTTNAASIKSTDYPTKGGNIVLPTKVAHDRVSENNNVYPTHIGAFSRLLPYYPGLANEDVGKVIDKELLVGFKLNISLHPLNDADVGIYELYHNDDWDGDGVNNYIEVENSDHNVAFNPLSSDESKDAIALKNTTERGYHHNGELVKYDAQISSSALAGQSDRSNGLRLPNSGKGYYYYRGADNNNSDNYAILQTLQKIEGVGRVWSELHPDAYPLIVNQIVKDGNYYGSDPGGSGGKRFGIGDISLPGGRQFCWAEGECHATHRAGLDLDVRYMSREGYGDGGFDLNDSTGRNMYDSDLTKELIGLFAAVGADQVYVDEQGRDRIFSKTDTDGNQESKASEFVTFANGARVYVKRIKNHSNHFHVRFPLANPPVGTVNLTSSKNVLPFYGSARITSDAVLDRQGWPLLQFTQLIITATEQQSGTPIGILEGEQVSGEGWTAKRVSVDADSRLNFDYSAGKSTGNAFIRVWVGDKNTGPKDKIDEVSIQIEQAN